MKETILLGLLFTVGAGISLHGAELPSSSQGEGVPDGHIARIVALDKEKRMLTLQIKNADYRFDLNPRVINTRTHQQITLDQIAAGQLISFVTRPRFDGRLEIVSMMVLPHESGGSGGGGSRGGRVEVSPFQ